MGPLGPVRCNILGEPELAGRPMLMNLYLFCFALGGVLLAASLMMGGDDGAGDADVDIDGDVEADSDSHSGDHGDLGGFFAALISLRFWTFFLAFFGMTGTVFEWRELAGHWAVVLGIAFAVGALAGVVAVKAFKWLAAGEHGHVPGSDEYVGKSGRILIRVSSSEVGKIRLEMRGATEDLLATTDESATIEIGSQALVIEMRGTTAVVTSMPSKSTEN